MKQFYDTDLQSEHPPSDMFSDKAIPKEKLNRQKILYKKELFHVLKEVRLRGVSYEKPAYFDKVKFKTVILDEEQYCNGDIEEILETAEVVEQNVLSPEADRWIDKALQSMKKDERSIFIQEHLQYDENQLKVLEKKVYQLIQMIDWQIIVDIFQDQTYLKYMLKKGSGSDRCELLDEIIYSIKLYYGEQLIFEESQDGPTPIKLMKSKNVLRILKTMKNHEHSICHIKYDAFLENEGEEFLESINFDQSTKEEWRLDIDVKTLFKIDDLYGDGVLVKTTLYRSRNTAKPEKVSLIDFDLWIYQMTTDPYPQQQNLLYSSIDSEPIYNKIEAQKHVEEDENPSEGSLQVYIDDLKVSKLMRLALLRMKKRELSIIRCYDTSDLIKNGLDYEGLKGKINKELVYVIYVHNFSEGKNNFNMTIDEKIEQAIRKKQIGLKWISQQNYKKALKVFKAINAYFDYGTFTEEDKEKMKEFQISSLLNSSLCLMKLKEWREMKVVAEKLYKLDSQNHKIIYRYCYALMNLQEYEEALKIITEDNEELINLKNNIENLLTKYQSKQKLMYQKMFS